ILKKDSFIGNDFISDGLFKLNVTSFPINKIFISSEPVVLNVESVDTWHSQLGHVNFTSLSYMSNLKLIP
nr:GAG-pre-integrase domain-containing protein [Serratia marcescens]